MTLTLDKTITDVKVDYTGKTSYVLPAGSEVEFKMKVPGSGWDKILETEVPEGKQWNFIITLMAHESNA